MDEIKKFSLGSTEPSKKTSPEFEKEYMSFQIKWLEDCIKELKQSQQWQSIETAPKDGTWVLAIEEHSTKPFIANFRKQKGGDIIFADWYADNDYVCFPILWMPLPKPPTQ